MSSVLPKPTRETLTEALVMKINAAVASMCRRMSKYGKNRVYYMPLHQYLLEKWSHKDDKSGKMRKTTRIIQPHGRFYRIGMDVLNSDGVNMIVSRIVDYVWEKQDKNVVLMERPGLIVEIDNSSGSEQAARRGESRPSQVVKSDKGRILSVEGGRRQKPKSERGQMLQCKEVAKSGREAGVCKGKKESQVTRLVDKWEKLSHGQSVSDLDLELGRESVVRVDLGDQPNHIDPELDEFM